MGGLHWRTVLGEHTHTSSRIEVVVQRTSHAETRTTLITGGQEGECIPMPRCGNEGKSCKLISFAARAGMRRMQPAEHLHLHDHMHTMQTCTDLLMNTPHAIETPAEGLCMALWTCVG